jgi:Tat protein translocase TatB subunit
LYLLILESIGTSELILIGLIALIVFGPRKLPQIARTIGKTVTEFKRAGQEFKTTWEKEVNLEEEKAFFKDPLDENLIIAETKYTQTTTVTETKILPPEIKEISQADFPEPHRSAEAIQTERKADSVASKQDWL